MKEYSKGIYVKFKPEEVDKLHNRMQEAGVQNMSAYIRKMELNGYVIIPEWPDPDFYLHRERIRQLYTELYKEKNITQFRNTKISIERKVAA